MNGECFSSFPRHRPVVSFLSRAEEPRHNTRRGPSPTEFGVAGTFSQPPSRLRFLTRLLQTLPSESGQVICFYPETPTLRSLPCTFAPHVHLAWHDLWFILSKVGLSVKVYGPPRPSCSRFLLTDCSRVSQWPPHPLDAMRQVFLSQSPLLYFPCLGGHFYVSNVCPSVHPSIHPSVHPSLIKHQRAARRDN